MRNSKEKKRFIVFGLLPSLILYTIFMVYPTINVFYESLFKTGGLSGNKTFVGLDNFKLLFSDSNFIRSFQNTIFLIVIVTIVTMFLAIIFASILSREKIAGQNFFRIIFTKHPFYSSYCINFCSNLWNGSRSYKWIYEII